MREKRQTVQVRPTSPMGRQTQIEERDRRRGAVYRLALSAGFFCSFLGLGYMIEFEASKTLRASDPMALSGWALAFLELWLAGRLEQSFGRAFKCMWVEGILGDNHHRIAAVARLIDNRARSWERWSGIAFGVVLAGVNIWWYIHTYGWPNMRWVECIYYTLLFLFLAGLAGGRLGRSAAYGCFGRLLNAAQVRLWLVPGHPDGAGGVRVYSDFLFLQAALIAILLLWLSCWVVVLTVVSPQWRVHLYPNWTLPLVGLLFAAMFFFVAAVLVPLRGFGRLMRISKAMVVSEWTSVLGGKQLLKLHERVSLSNNLDDLRPAQQTLLEHITRLQSALDLPTTPLIGRTMQLFRLNVAWPFLTVLFNLVVSGEIEGMSILNALWDSLGDLAK